MTRRLLWTYDSAETEIGIYLIERDDAEAEFGLWVPGEDAELGDPPRRRYETVSAARQAAQVHYDLRMGKCPADPTDPEISWRLEELLATPTGPDTRMLLDLALAMMPRWSVELHERLMCAQRT